MNRLTIIIGSLLVLLIGGGFWLFSSKKIDQNYENPALGPISSENAVVDGTDENAARAVPSETQDAVPMAGKEVTAATGGNQTTTTPNVPLATVSKLLAYGFRVPNSPRSIDTIVIHSSYNALGGDVFDVAKVLQEYEQYGVGAHYLIDRGGVVYLLVEEKNIAYHAGTSKMPDGRKNVNDFSIGIEMIGTEKGGYTTKQYTALNTLITDIKSRSKIKSIVGHSDIAPGRKTDPWQFDWKKLEQ